MYILAVIIGDLVGKRMNIRWLREFCIALSALSEFAFCEDLVYL